jgi:hypothetical protein
LLVPAGKGRDWSVDAIRLDLQQLGHIGDCRLFRLSVDHAESAEPLDGCEREIVAHRHR